MNAGDVFAGTGYGLRVMRRVAAAAGAYAEPLLDSVCDLERGVQVSTPTGGTRIEWRPVAVDLPCQITPGGGAITLTAEQLEAGNLLDVECPRTTDIRVGDQIRRPGEPMVRVIAVEVPSSLETTRHATGRQIR